MICKLRHSANLVYEIPTNKENWACTVYALSQEPLLRSHRILVTVPFQLRRRQA